RYVHAMGRLGASRGSLTRVSIWAYVWVVTRRCIGLDGYFLNGVTNGQLLIVVAKEENNQMFPIAWAVVEYEKHMDIIFKIVDRGFGIKRWQR
ncbi:hypothetical protein HAX54_024551, partial [Datura stramonium]|nr:hypothetical protein [Datura stramonium]